MTLFTKIYNKEIPGYILTENKEFFVLLDKFPLQKGHVLIIPKQEIDNILDMDDAQYQRMMTYAKEIATKLRSAVEAKRIGFLIEGFMIPHVHVHLVPVNDSKEMESSNSREMSDEESENIYKELKPHFA